MIVEANTRRRVSHSQHLTTSTVRSNSTGLCPQCLINRKVDFFLLGKMESVATSRYVSLNPRPAYNFIECL
jgi:hypothetical protein